MNAVTTAILTAQQGIHRLAGEGVNVEIELAQILVAFEHRQPDAMARAEAVRDRLVTEARGCLDTAAQQQKTVEAGRTFRHVKKSGVQGFAAYADAQRAAARARDEAEPSAAELEAGYMGTLRFDEQGDFQLIDADVAKNINRATNLSAAASHVSDIIDLFKNVRLKDGDLRDEKGLPAPGPTTETLYQLRHMKGGDPVLRLFATGKLTADQVRSAREIEAVQRWVTTGLGMKVQRLPVKIDASDETASSSRRSPGEHQEHMALLHASVYVPWTHGTDHMGLRKRLKAKAEPSVGEQFAAECADMVRELVGGDSLKEVARRHQMRWAEALRKVTGALDRYAKLRRDFSREDTDGASAARTPRTAQIQST